MKKEKRSGPISRFILFLKPIGHVQKILNKKANDSKEGIRPEGFIGYDEIFINEYYQHFWLKTTNKDEPMEVWFKN